MFFKNWQSLCVNFTKYKNFTMKDNFSSNSDLYAKYRPSLPIELFDYILELVPSREKAWDCATGNGQSAYILSKYFHEIQATDISEEQLKNAAQEKNIVYSQQAAEQTQFPDDYFDLIVISQALHWFDFDSFFAEAKRLLKDKGIIAAMGYDLPRISPEINDWIDRLYKDIIGEFWDVERRLIDSHYQTIPFPFEEISIPDFHIHDEWELEDLIGYLKTWSGVKHYTKALGKNPIDEILDELTQAWGTKKSQKVTFPVFHRIGRFNRI
jgi:SAM-dependent methyltransferase